MDKEAINKRFLEVVNYLLATKKAVNKGELSNVLGIKATKFSEILNNRMGIGTDLAAMVCMKYEICPNWLLTGRGSMLKQTVQNQNDSAQSTGNTLISSDKYKQKNYINQEESSYLYKIYQEEKADWKAEKEKKESQIDHLQSELRAKSEELAVLKARYQHPDEAAFAFTPGLPEAYTESSLPMNQPTKSLGTSSAVKI